MCVSRCFKKKIHKANIFVSVSHKTEDKGGGGAENQFIISHLK